MAENSRAKVKSFGLVKRVEEPRHLIPVLILVVLAWIIALLIFHKASDVSDAVKALGILAGGLWVAYQFVLHRAFESALLIKPTVRSYKRNQNYVVSIDVTLANIGHRRIVAPQKLMPEDIEKYENSIKYPGDLQVKRIKSVTGAAAFIGWWTNNVEDVPDIPEHICLLFEYSDTKHDIEFFIEPEEKYTLGTTFVLPEGDYLAKIVFVGTRSTASEFWSRIVHFRVPHL